MIKGKELHRHLKLIRGMADVLNMLADEVEHRGKMDDTDLGTLSKVGAKLMYVSVAMPFTQ